MGWIHHSGYFLCCISVGRREGRREREEVRNPSLSISLSVRPVEAQKGRHLVGETGPTTLGLEGTITFC
jgi:hypothetical protein